MKILHTGDWHLGKIVNEYSMLEDQKYIFDQLFKVIDEEKPDVLVVAGDIYDRSIPPKEAVELLDDILNRLSIEYQIPTLMISGNHDSHERLDFGKRLLEKGELYIEGKFSPLIRKVSFEDTFGSVNFFLVPYVNPSLARFIYSDETITDHQGVMEKIVASLKLNANERNVLINHNFFTGAIEEAYTSDSERSLSIGGTEVIDVNLVKDFDYVALGHLHRPQKIGFNHVRYSGSLLKYSTSEINTSKGVYTIELKEKGNLNLKFHSLTPRRDFIKLEGTLEELISKSFYSTIDTNNYIYAVLTDTKELYDPIGQLRAVYPNIMQLDRPHSLLELNDRERQASMKNKTPFELYQDFYSFITGEELEESYVEAVQKMMLSVKEGCEE